MSELREELLRARLRGLNAEAEHLELDNKRVAREVAAENASSTVNRVLRFYGPILKETVAEAIVQIDNWFRQDPTKPILLDFYSDGGGVVAGFALFDRIRHLQAQGAVINTKATGVAASMAAVLLQAGTERIVSPNAFIMLHEVATQMSGSNQDLKDQAKFLDRMQSKAEDILLERSTLTRTSLRKKWVRQDCWLDAQEALALGLVDRIEE